MSDLSNTPIRSAAGRFLPGCSGNPGGRPRGARNKASVLAEMLDEAESAAIVRAVVDRALAGHWPALRTCFTRLFPPAKAAPVEIDLPPIASAADVAEAGSALIAAVAAGEITPSEAQQVMKLLSAQLRNLAAASRTSAVAQSAEAANACISPVLSGAEAEAAGELRAGHERADLDPLPCTLSGDNGSAGACGRDAAPAARAHACISPVPSGVAEPVLADVPDFLRLQAPRDATGLRTTTSAIALVPPGANARAAIPVERLWLGVAGRSRRSLPTGEAAKAA